MINEELKKAKLYAMEYAQNECGRNLSSYAYERERLFTAKDLEIAFLEGSGVKKSESSSLLKEKESRIFYHDL